MENENQHDIEQNSEKSELESTKQLKVSIREGQAWTRFLEIEVPATDIATQFESTFQEYRKKAKIPGFRPGKAPIGIIKQRFSDSVKADVFEDAVSGAYQRAIQQEKLIPISDPKLSDIQFEEGKPLKFKAEIEIRPTVTLSKYKGFRVERRARTIGEKELNEAMDDLRERLAEFHPVQRPAENGDLIIVDLVKKHDKLNRLKEDKLENIEIILGSKGILDEFQKGLLGMRVGEMKDISVTYPDHYHDPNLAGDQILYLTVAKEIKKKVLPEINDEFVGKVSKLKDLQELRDNLKSGLEKQAQDDATRVLKNELIKQVINSNLFDVPISILNNSLDSMVEDFKKRGESFDEKEVRTQFRSMAENSIRWIYLYHEIAKAENITVSSDDRKKWVQAFASSYNISEEDAKTALGKSKKQQDIDDSILESKVLEFVMNNSEIINN